MAAPQNGGKKKGHSAIVGGVAGKDTIEFHQHSHGRVFKKWAPPARREIQKFAVKEMGAPDVHGSRAQQTCLRQGNKACPLVQVLGVVRKPIEDEGSPGKLWTWVTSIAVTTFKIAQSVWTTTNC